MFRASPMKEALKVYIRKGRKKKKKQAKQRMLTKNIIAQGVILSALV